MEPREQPADRVASACSDDGTPAGGDGPTNSAASGGGQGGDGGSGGGPDSPGVSATFLWTGRLHEPQQMPIACAAAPDNPYADNCPRAVAVQPGPFKIALQLFSAATCEDLYCSVSDPFTVEQDFTYPDDTEIAIAVD